MRPQTTTEIANRQSVFSPIDNAVHSGLHPRPLLPDLLDRHLHALKQIEDDVAGGLFFGGSLVRAAATHADWLQQEADVITDPRHPLRWCTHLRLLLGVQGAKLDDMKRRAKLAGSPQAKYELLVSTQIMEALMRGHVLAASTSGDSTDEADGDGELVAA